MNSFYEWMQNQYDQEELDEIARHGCASGCAGGLIYYSETSAIYQEYAEELHEKVGELIAMTGEIPSFITDNISSASHFRNAMVWLVAEIYAQELAD
jgi:mevalonate pyrophosphate decarboxylase